MVTDMSRERGAAALVAVRGGGSTSPVRRLSPPSCRCRPGDVPEWVRLDLSAIDGGALRDAAAAAEVSLDAWLAVMLEFSVTLRMLVDALGSLDRARAQLSRKVEAFPVAVAVLPDWRAWQASLSRRVPAGPDELPEVVLPQRLVARCGGTIDVSDAFSAASDWALARACELAASGRGQTLEAFALEAGLASMPRTRG
jgi:hypothetical protein